MQSNSAWPTRAKRMLRIERGLEEFSTAKKKLLGIQDVSSRRTLAKQMVASLRRMDYTEILKQRPIDPRRVNPNDSLFDPERAAIFYSRSGNLDEAVWIIFLATHFGRHPRHGWRRLRDVYSGLEKKTWSWKAVTEDVQAFRKWLSTNEASIRGAFGNHRKYESLSGSSRKGTGEVVASYVEWIGPNHSHRERFGALIQAGGNDPHEIFDRFYRAMNVAKFGRLGKFDFLALLGRLELAPINPGSTYLSGASGPLKGARLLFEANPSANVKISDLENWLIELDSYLNIGMQVMEDSICNWQKSPDRFVHFRG
jgi:hypothetical protein